MIYQPKHESVEAVPASAPLCGRTMVIVSAEGRAHAVDQEFFELFFAPDPSSGTSSDGANSGAVLQTAPRHKDVLSSAAVAQYGHGIRLPNNAAAALKNGAARKAVAKTVAPPAGKPKKGEFDAYPPAIRDPRGKNLRFVWDALKAGPADCHDIQMRCEKLGWTGAEEDFQNVQQTIYRLKEKHLVVKDDQFRWSRVN
jgi:hypothetical protein